MEFTIKYLRTFTQGTRTMLLNLFILHKNLASATDQVVHRHFISKWTHSYTLKTATIKVLNNK